MRWSHSHGQYTIFRKLLRQLMLLLQCPHLLWKELRSWINEELRGEVRLGSEQVPTNSIKVLETE